MKMSKIILAGVLITQLASAQTIAPKTIVLNPESLRKEVLNKNISILTELNQVHIAKDQVNIARGNLLPSLNLSAIATPKPTFLLSAISFLLPFLMPSNWFNVAVQKYSFEAEKDSYWIMQLNTYSSALAVYYTLLADLQTKQVYEDEAQDLNKIYEFIHRQSTILQTVAGEDVNHAKSQYESADAQASMAKELTLQELASIRLAIGESLSTQITLQPTQMPASEWEQKNIQAAVDAANTVAPEHKQNLNLIQMSQKQKWSNVFAFINSTSLSSQGTSTGSTPSAASFGNLTARGSVGIGFAYFPTLELSNHSIDAMQLRETSLIESNTRILESAMKSVEEAKNQLDLATHAASEMSKVYKSKLKRYSLGLGVSYMTVLLARTQAVQASLQKVNAELDLNLQRVTLHRTLLTDEFSKIMGCQAVDGSAPRPKGFFKSLFGGKKVDHSLDEICHPQPVIAVEGDDDQEE